MCGRTAAFAVRNAVRGGANAVWEKRRLQKMKTGLEGSGLCCFTGTVFYVHCTVLHRSVLLACACQRSQRKINESHSHVVVYLFAVTGSPMQP